MKKIRRTLKRGGMFDYDPTNQYHVHIDGEKVVIDKEQYEKHKDEPYFSNIRKQVEEHQAAYSEPEYEETPNPKYEKAYWNVYQNTAGYSHGFDKKAKQHKYAEVPDGYTRDKNGVVTDKEGNLYRPIRDLADLNNKPAAFTTTERNRYHGGYYDKAWVRLKTPPKTIRTLKQPLPIDRTYNVEEDLDDILKTPYEYKLKVQENNWWVGALSETLLSRLMYEARKGRIKGMNDAFIVPKNVYDNLKDEVDKWNNISEQNYLKSKYVTPIYPTKDYINKIIKLNINAKRRLESNGKYSD